MSKTIPASKAMRAAGLHAALEPARRLAGAIAAAVLARAMRQALRGLAALDDRTLAGIGIDCQPTDQDTKGKLQ